MTKLQIFDPPMCCTSGVCGTNVDTKLVKLLNDIEWLKSKGVEVERFGLAFEPQAFVSNELVKETLQKDGNDCLPLILVDGEIAFKGGYPDRAKLAEFCGVKFEEEVKEEAENVSVGCCGPDCDCHQTSAGNKCKTVILIIILLLIAIILAVKFSAKAGAATTKTQTQTMQGFVSSIAEAKKSGQDTTFVFVPSKSNVKMSILTQTAIIAAQSSLKAKKITSKLYTLDAGSADYNSIAAKNQLPAIVVLGKNGKKSIVSGKITTGKLLQAYVEINQVGCGADCPCHRK